MNWKLIEQFEEGGMTKCIEIVAIVTLERRRKVKRFDLNWKLIRFYGDAK